LGQLLAVAGLFALASGKVFAQAQSATLPQPPAISIAQHLIDRHQYASAVKKLGDVVSSASYKGTAWAPASIYETAHIEEDDLHDNNAAIASFDKLINSTDYQAMNYPGRSTVVAERKALATKIDSINSRSLVWGFFPGYQFIKFFVSMTGAKSYSYWLALVIISVAVRLLLTPLTIKQYKSMREMQRLQPLMKDLQAKYKDQKDVLGAKTMELYKEHGVNPAAGCVPMLLQMPIFFLMYQCIRAYQYHFTAGTFLWICPYMHHQFPALIAANLSQADQILLFLYAGSMYVTQRMMPQTDPAQAEMQKTTAAMTSIFFFMFFQQYHYPSAFVLYWLISNILSTATQLFFMRRGDTPPPGTIPVLPSDGDSSFLNGKSGNGTLIKEGAGSGSARTMRSVQGTSRGVIAPKVYPKKKRR
jgi:YidC/Oxa1 family membrane protein insertase